MEATRKDTYMYTCLNKILYIYNYMHRVDTNI